MTDKLKRIMVAIAFVFVCLPAQAEPDQCILDASSANTFMRIRERIMRGYHGSAETRKLPIYTYALTTVSDTVVKHGEAYLANPECVQYRKIITQVLDWLKTQPRELPKDTTPMPVFKAKP